MKSAELVMDQPSASKGIAESAGNSIKSILFPVHEDQGLEARLQTALSLARSCSAHLQLLQIIPLEAYTMVDAYGGTFVSAEIVQALEEQASKVRTRLESQLAKEDVSWSYEVKTSATIPELLKNAALADLIVVGRHPPNREFNHSGPSLLGELVYRVQTPLCIPGDGATSFDPFGKAIIAWNGSIEAANAIRAGLGLLKLASDVTVVRCTEEKETAFPDTRLLEYLSRHGVHPRLDVRTLRQDITDDLIEYAGVFRAEYIVIGAYSHSRAGEFLFGGVTRDLLRGCPISLVMAH